MDIGLKVADNVRDNRRVGTELARLTGRTVEEIDRDLGRDFYLSADEAVAYGVCDHVMQPREETNVKEIYYANPWFVLLLGDRLLSALKTLISCTSCFLALQGFRISFGLTCSWPMPFFARSRLSFLKGDLMSREEVATRLRY